MRCAKRPVHWEQVFCLSVDKAYFLATASLKRLPAENAGTVFAAILSSLPVCGLRPVRAARLRGSNVPKPIKVTFLPLATVLAMVSIIDAKTSSDCFLENFVFLAIS